MTDRSYVHRKLIDFRSKERIAMNTKNNQRFQSTEAVLEQVFLELCKNTPPQKVTVSQLCIATGLNRSTFYAHYLDVPDLIYKTGRKHIASIGEIFRESSDSVKVFLNPTYLARMISYIGEHADFFQVYFTYNQPRIMLDNFSRLFEDFKPYMMSRGLTNESVMLYHFDYFRAGFVSILIRWLNLGCIEKPEELAQIILHNLPASTQF